MQTKIQFEQRVDSMLPELLQRIREETIRLFSSGALDIEAHDNDYVLPKICLTVAIENQVHQYMPLHPDHKKEVANLRKF
jgi:hypothetical protein